MFLQPNSGFINSSLVPVSRAAWSCGLRGTLQMVRIIFSLIQVATMLRSLVRSCVALPGPAPWPIQSSHSLHGNWVVVSGAHRFRLPAAQQGWPAAAAAWTRSGRALSASASGSASKRPWLGCWSWSCSGANTWTWWMPLWSTEPPLPSVPKSLGHRRGAQPKRAPPRNPSTDLRHAAGNRSVSASVSSSPGSLHDEIIKYGCGVDGDLPANQSLCG